MRVEVGGDAWEGGAETTVRGALNLRLIFPAEIFKNPFNICVR